MPIPFSPNTRVSGPYLGALDSAAATAAFGFLWERASQGQVRRDAPDHCWGHRPRSQGHGGGAKGGRQTRRPSPLHPQARRLRRRGSPTPLITYMRGGGLGSSCSLVHGSVEVMEAPGRDAAPAGFCKGKSVGRGPQALPQPAGWGGSVYRQGAGGLRLGLSLSHFLLLWVLPLPPPPHLPLRPPAPHAAPRGAGVPELNQVWGKNGESRGGPGRGHRAAAVSRPGPRLDEGRSGAGGPGGASVRIRWPRLTPARRC